MGYEGGGGGREEGPFAHARQQCFRSFDRMRGLPRFIPLWCLVMPITSFLIVPSIQGTIPAYLMAFASLLLVLASDEKGWFELQRGRYLSIAVLLTGSGCFCFVAGS